MHSTSACFPICIAAAALVDFQQQMNAAPQPAAELLCMYIWSNTTMQIGNSQRWHSSAGFVYMTKHCVCRFCERIIPVQITCSMTQQALTSATQRLAKLHAKQAVEASEDQLVKFAGQSIIFLPPISVCTCNHLVLHMCRCHVSYQESQKSCRKELIEKAIHNQ